MWAKVLRLWKVPADERAPARVASIELSGGHASFRETRPKELRPLNNYLFNLEHPYQRLNTMLFQDVLGPILFHFDEDKELLVADRLETCARTVQQLEGIEVEQAADFGQFQHVVGLAGEVFRCLFGTLAHLNGEFFVGHADCLEAMLDQVAEMDMGQAFFIIHFPVFLDCSILPMPSIFRLRSGGCRA